MSADLKRKFSFSSGEETESADEGMGASQNTDDQLSLQLSDVEEPSKKNKKIKLSDEENGK